MNSPFAASSIITALTSLFIGLFILFKNPSRKLFQIWFLFTLSVSIWGIGGFFIALSKDSALSTGIWRLTYAFGVIWIPVTFLHFVKIFCNQKKSYPKYIYGANLAFFALSFTPFLVGDVRWAFDSIYYGTMGNPIIFQIFLLWWGILFLSGLLILISSLKELKDSYKKKQIEFMFIGIGIGAAGGSFNFIPFFKIDIYPWGNFAVALYPLIIGYAILKHQLLDVRVAFKKTVAYSLFTFMLSILYLFFVFFLQRIFVAQELTAYSIKLSLFSILFIAILFKPLEILLHRFLERRFFKGTIFEIAQENEKLESALERQQRLKSVGILAAGMAHEIKNPLTAIQTFTDYLPKKYDDPEFRSKFHRIVNQEVERIKNIVSNLLLFSRPQELNPREADISNILKDILDLLSNEFLKFSIKLNHNLDENFPKVNIDAEQMKQVFLNIIINAIDAMKERGGVLQITLLSDLHRLQVSIKDSGRGISKERLPYIFDPFYSDKDDGTGLGLAIAHSIIAKHAGTISVVSHLDKGTDFLISLPAEL